MGRARRRGIGVLPSLFTLGNLLCGFGSIAYISGGPEAGPDRFVKAAWLILFAMFFDALDGRIARLAKLTSRFGAELDSLADIVTFGIAPALLVKAVAAPLIHPRLLWPLCALYAACAALRLARFNVETTPDPKAHMSFTGLPTPPAAGVVASLFILHEHLTKPDERVFWMMIPDGMFDGVLPRVLPFLVVALGALMISRLPNPHLLSRILGGRRSFTHFVALLFVGILAAIETEVILAVGFVAFALSGPVASAVRRVRQHRAEREPTGQFRVR